LIFRANLNYFWLLITFCTFPFSRQPERVPLFRIKQLLKVTPSVWRGLSDTRPSSISFRWEKPYSWRLILVLVSLCGIYQIRIVFIICPDNETLKYVTLHSYSLTLYCFYVWEGPYDPKFVRIIIPPRFRIEVGLVDETKIRDLVICNSG
jgi:hypothetical protein